MYFRTKTNGQVILTRCECSHDWDSDMYKYKGLGDAGGRIQMGGTLRTEALYCKKCNKFGWRIEGMTDEELKRREV